MRLLLSILMVAVPWGSSLNAASVRDFELLSINAANTASGNGASLNPVVSTNGLFVAFASDAANLVANDNNGARDVFWRDRVSGTTRLVSRTAAGASGDRESDAPVISADGRYVAFHSRATNLVANDTNASYDVFLWDSADNSVTLVSRSLAGGIGAGDSYSPQLSANGRIVSFASQAADLVANDTNATADAFVRNLDTSVTFLASINTNNAAGAGASGVPVLSANGRYVAFLSRAADLVTNDFNAHNDIFVHDLQTRVTRLVSANVAGTGAGNRISFDPAISADGRYVAFASQATNLVTLTDTNDFQDVFVRDMQLGVTKLVSVNGAGTASGGTAGISTILPASFNPFLSADGTKVLFTSLAQDLVPGDANAQQDVFLRDHINNTTTLISTNRFGTGSGNAASGAGSASMSADLRYVAFFSGASDVGAVDTNNRTDVFLRDLTTGNTKIISRVSLGGFAANGHSFQPVISADGSTVFFLSEADNLDNRDANARSDVFAASTTLAAPSFGPADVGVGISPIGQQQLGSNFSYTVSVTNLSTNLVTGLRITNDASNLFQFLSATLSRGFLPADSSIWTIGDLAPGSVATAVAFLRPTNVGPTTVTAAVFSLDQSDSDPTNNTASSAVSVEAPDLVVSLSGPVTAAFGTDFTVTYTVTNRGAFPALSAILTQPDPGAVEFRGAVPSRGTVNPETGWAIGPLPAGGSATLVVTWRPTSSGVLQFAAAVTNAVPEAELGNNQANLTIPVPNLAPVVQFATSSLVYLEDVGPVTRPAFLQLSPVETNQLITSYTVSASTPSLFQVQPAIGVDGTLTFTPAANSNGSATITVIAQDDGGTANSGVDRTTNTFTLTVTPVNDAPSFTFASNTIVVLEGAGAVTLANQVASTATGSVPEPPQLLTNYVVTTTNTALFTVQPALSVAGTLTFTLAPDANGTAYLTVQAQDDGGTANGGTNGSTLVPLTLNILPVNDAPVVTLAMNNVVALEDSGVTTVPGFYAVQVGPANESSQSITNLSFSVSPPGFLTNGPSINLAGALSFTPTSSVVGSATVTVITEDDGGTANGGVNRTTNTFTITVTPVNDAPGITFAASNVQLVRDQGAQTFAGFATLSAGPADESSQTVVIHSVTAANPTLFSTQPTITAGTLTFTSALRVLGSSVITVIAEDDGGTANGGVSRTTNSFTITVTDSAAANYVWNGSVGDWNDPTKWTPTGVPGAADTASIGAGTVTLTNGVSVVALTVTGGTLTGAGNITIPTGGTFTWNGGTLAGTGTLTLAASSSGSAASNADKQLGRTVNNAGTFTWSGGQIKAINSPTFNNQASGLFDIQVDNTFCSTADGSVRTFNNAGTLRKSAGGSITAWEAALNNMGTVDVQTGTLSLTGSGTSSGAFTNAAGTVLEWNSGTNVLGSGATFTGPGTRRIANGTLLVSAGTTVSPAGTFEQTGGTLGGAGNFTVPSGGAFNWTIGTMATGGVFTVASGGTLTASTGSSKVLRRQLNNAGTFIWTGGQIAAGDSPILNNQANGLFDIQTDSTFFNSVDASVGTFNNAGTLRKSAGTGTSTWLGTLNNTDTLELRTGTLILSSPYAPSAGSALTIYIGGTTAGTEFARLVGGTTTFAGTLNVVLTNSFVPVAGNSFAVVDSSSGGSGIFSATTGRTLGGGLFLATNYAAGDLTLVTTVSNTAPVVTFATTTVVVAEDSGAFSQAGFAAVSLGGAAESGQSVTNYTVTTDNAALFAAGPALSLAGTLSFTPVANANGTATVTVVAQDSGGTVEGGVDKATNTFTITLTPVNDAPVITYTTNVVVVLEDAGAQTVTGFATGAASDAGQSVTNYVVTATDTGLFSVVPALAVNGTLTFTPAANANGSTVVTVIAQDDGGTANGGVDKTTNTFTITLTPVNDAPVITYTTNVMVVLEDAGAQTVTGFATGAASDAGQSVTNYTVTAANKGLFSTEPAIAVNGTLTFTPAANANGSTVVTVIAQDDGGTANGGVDKATNTFIITLTPVNDAPMITYTTNVVVVLEDAGAQTVTGFATGAAVEAGQSVTNYTVTASDGSLFSVSPTIAVNGTLTFTPAANANGSTVVTVIAQDDGGTANGGVDKTTNTFTITLTPVNDAPVITYTTNLVVVLEDAGAQTVTGFATGAAVEAGQSVTNYAVTATDTGLFSAVPTIAVNGTLTFTPAANANGSTVVTVIAQDDGGTANGGVDKTTNTFTITLTPVNDAPTLTLSIASLGVAEDIGLTTFPGLIQSFSPGPANESSQLRVGSYVVTNTHPSLFTVQPAVAADGTLTFTGAPNATGLITVTVRAQDDGGTADAGVDTGTTTFLLELQEQNDAPSFTFATNNVVVLEDSGAATVSGFIATSSVGPTQETSSQAITNYAVTAATPSLFAVQPAIGTNGTLTFTPAANANGVDTITVIAQDDGGTGNSGVDKTTNTFTLTITAVNDSPSFTLTSAIATDGLQDWVADGAVSSSTGLKVVTDSSGNVFVAGEREIVDEVNTFQAELVKYSNTGVAQWTNSIAGEGSFPNVRVRGLAVDSTGAVILTAMHSGGANTDFLTMKFAAGGSLVWSNRWDGLADDEPMAVTVDGNNKIIVVGKSVTNSYTDFLTVKYLADGTPFWTNRWSFDSIGHDVPRSVAVDSANDVYVAGDGSDTDFTFAVLLKLAANDGVPAWTNRFDVGGESSTGEAVRVGGGDFIYLAGTLNDNLVNQSYFGVAKYSAAGAVVWTNLYARNVEPGHVHGLAVDASGNAIITGNTEVSANMDFTTIKYLANGTPAWTNHYQGPAGGRDHPNAIAVNSAGEVFVTGDSADGLFTKDWATVKYTADGVGVWTNRYVGSSGGNDTPNAIAVDSGTNVFVTGVADAVMKTIKYAYVTTAGANQSRLTNAGAISVPGFIATSSAGPANESAQTISYVVSTDNPDLFTAQPAINAAGVLTYTVSPTASGLAVVTVYAQDSGGTANGGTAASASQTFQITVLTGTAAASYTWTGGTGDWNDPGNWTPRGVPGVADSATIVAGSAQLTNTVTVAQLVLSSGTVGGVGSFTVRSNMTWSGGTMSGAGRTTISSGATLAVDGTTDKDLRRRLDNYGTVTWAAGRILGHDGPTINNYAGALLDTQSEATLFESGDGTTKTFNNFGTVRKSAGTGTSAWSGSFNNSGTVNVQTGTLNPSGSVTLNSSTYTGTGQFMLTGATLAGTLTIAAGADVDFASGTLSGTGTVVGTMSWTGGTFGLGSTITIATNGVLLISDATDKDLRGTLDNYGTVTWMGARILGHDAPVIHNRAGAVFDVQVNTTLFESGDGTIKTFNNFGTVRKSVATGTSTWLGTFSNSGVLELQSGILLLTNNYAPAAGSTLRIYLGGLTAGTQFGQLQVGGATTAAGTLAIVLTNSFTPVAGNSFLVVDSASGSGTFASLTGSALGGGLALVPNYSSGDVTLATTATGGLPRMAQMAAGAERTLRWSGAAVGYVLETADSITGPWIQVVAPVAQEHGDNVVHLPAEGTRFYRLVPVGTPRPGGNPAQ